VVESNCDLHVLVLSVGVAVAQKHHFIVVSHVIVGDGNGGRPVNGVDQPIIAVRQGAVVNPYVASAEDGDAITVGYGPPPVVAWGVPHHSIPPLLTVMDIYPVDYNIGHILYRNAWPTRNVHASASSVDGLEGVHDKLLLQLNHHVPGEYDPERLLLNHRVTERPRLRRHRVIVAGIRHHVDFPVLSSNRVFPKPNCTIRQPLPVLLPVGVTPPTVVYWVTCPT